MALSLVQGAKNTKLSVENKAFVLMLHLRFSIADLSTRPQTACRWLEHWLGKMKNGGFGVAGVRTLDVLFFSVGCRPRS